MKTSISLLFCPSSHREGDTIAFTTIIFVSGSPSDKGIPFQKHKEYQDVSGHTLQAT